MKDWEESMGVELGVNRTVWLKSKLDGKRSRLQIIL